MQWQKQIKFSSQSESIKVARRIKSNNANYDVKLNSHSRCALDSCRRWLQREYPHTCRSWCRYCSHQITLLQQKAIKSFSNFKPVHFTTCGSPLQCTTSTAHQLQKAYTPVFNHNHFTNILYGVGSPMDLGCHETWSHFSIIVRW